MRPGPGRQRRTGAAYTCSFDIQIAAFGDQRHAARQIEQAAVGTGLDPEANAQRTGSKSRRWQGDRKSVVWGKSVSVRVDLGGRRIITKKQTNNYASHPTVLI